jgi:hypothetical protein
MSRYFPRARGSAFVIRRKMSHVHLTLEERPAKKSSKAKAVKKVEKAKETGVGTPDTESAAPMSEEHGTVKQKTLKTSQEEKANTVAQKRRPRSK